MSHALEKNDERATRNAMLAKLHVYKKHLGLDDEGYRGLLEARTGHRSAAELSVEQLGAVLDEMRRLFAPAPSPAAQRGPRAAHLELMRSLWGECALFGIVHSNSDRALARFVRRMTSIDRPEWLPPDAANVVIEALKIMKRKRAGRGT